VAATPHPAGTAPIHTPQPDPSANPEPEVAASIVWSLNTVRGASAGLRNVGPTPLLGVGVSTVVSTVEERRGFTTGIGAKTIQATFESEAQRRQIPVTDLEMLRGDPRAVQPKRVDLQPGETRHFHIGAYIPTLPSRVRVTDGDGREVLFVESIAGGP